MLLQFLSFKEARDTKVNLVTFLMSALYANRMCDIHMTYSTVTARAHDRASNTLQYSFKGRLTSVACVLDPRFGR